MRILHYNDEEMELHAYLARLGHDNVIMPQDEDPFTIVRGARFDAAFVGLHPLGLQLMRQMHQVEPSCPVTIITSDADTRSAVAAMKAGAFDYLLSPLNFAEIERVTILMGRHQAQHDRQRQLADELASATGQVQLIGKSAVMSTLRTLAAKAAASHAPVLITGQTGTGKELIARILHEQSSRANQPFVSINCNAIPSNLLESELFGYRKGAFTGADRNHTGLLAQAQGGTFFFDEIADLDFALQGKILRVVQESEVLPLGASKVQQLDLRFVAATNHDLAALIAEGTFRDDLYFRLNVIPLHVPPLQHRMEDVVLLTRHFIELYSSREGRAPLQVAQEVWHRLSHHTWPGNVRELENLCRRAVALTEGNTFDTDILTLTGSFTDLPASHGLLPAPAPTPGGRLQSARQATEKQAIEQALAEYHGNVCQASRALGISRTTFYAKVRRFRIDWQRRFTNRSGDTVT